MESQGHIERDLRTDFRAPDGTLYRAGKGRRIPLEVARAAGWAPSESPDGDQAAAAGPEDDVQPLADGPEDPEPTQDVFVHAPDLSPVKRGRGRPRKD